MSIREPFPGLYILNGIFSPEMRSREELFQHVGTNDVEGPPRIERIGAAVNRSHG